MKKILFALLIFMMPIFVFAKEYSIKDINLKMEIDDNYWNVFTRDNYKDNELLKSLGVTNEYMENYFTQNNAYVDALPKNYGLDLVVNTSTDGVNINNLHNYPDILLLILCRIVNTTSFNKMSPNIISTKHKAIGNIEFIAMRAVEFQTIF